MDSFLRSDLPTGGLQGETATPRQGHPRRRMNFLGVLNPAGEFFGVFWPFLTCVFFWGHHSQNCSSRSRLFTNQGHLSRWQGLSEASVEKVLTWCPPHQSSTTHSGSSSCPSVACPFNSRSTLQAPGRGPFGRPALPSLTTHSGSSSCPSVACPFNSRSTLRGSGHGPGQQRTDHPSSWAVLLCPNITGHGIQAVRLWHSGRAGAESSWQRLCSPPQNTRRFKFQLWLWQHSVAMILLQVHLQQPCYDFCFL